MTTTDLSPSRAEAEARGEPAGERPAARSVADGTRMHRLVARWRRRFAEELWPTVVLFAVLTSAATLTSSAGDYVGDNRFEQYWNPARRIAKSLSIWDGSRGFGRVREDFWPATTVPLAALRGLGFSPQVAEHLFHAMCLTFAAVGMVLVVRLFRERIGLEHFLAGCVMAFGAYSATFLVPSNLYFQYALAPWLFVVVYRGVRSDRPWRWAALFALLIFLPGNTDTPGLIYNCVPLASVAVYVVFVDRSVRWPNVLAWFVRAGALSLLVSAAVVAKTFYAAGALGQRLNDTEAAEVAANTSSWPESLRGLGNWLSYFSDGQSLLKPQGAPYFTNWVVVAFTFVPPCIALFVLWQSRWRGRLLFSMTMIASLLILIGGFPRADPSPLGGMILSAYTDIRALAAFRNTYKIGAGLVIGIAALFAYGIVLARRRLDRRHPRLRALPAAFAFLTIIVVGFPFWTGNLYDPTKRMQEVPEYWDQAFEHLGQIPSEGRSLVLPQTSRTRYRWGWVGDDIFDALDPRDHAIATGVPLSTPISASTLEAITLMGAEPMYVPGVIGPMARRLGITEIVLRNDVDWQALNRPRPAAFDGLRSDPDLELVATFGAPGTNTVAPDDGGPVADRERTLPPVEIYAVTDPSSGFTVSPAAAPILVSGDGFAWPGMARAGLLDGAQPLTFTGDLSSAELTTDLEAGAPLVITDANRRRLRVLLSYEPDYSYALVGDQDLDRPSQSLWKQPGSQSVAWYPDATSVAVSGPPRSLGGTQLWNRPANAFDGDRTTAWQIRRTDPQGRVFRIDLREPVEVSEMTVELPAVAGRNEAITRARLRFSDGDDVEVELDKGRTDVRFDPRRTEWIEFIPEDLSDTVPLVGIAELSFPEIDLREFVQAPDDVFRQAEQDPRLAAAVGRAPMAYVFTRSIQPTSQTAPPPSLAGADRTVEETALRRRFRSMGDHRLEASGALHFESSTPDQLVDAAIGGEIGAFGSSRHGGALSAIGGNAVDGSFDTAWMGAAVPGETLTLRFPKQVVRRVALDSQNDGISSHIEAVRVAVGDGPATDVRLERPSSDCVDDSLVAKACGRHFDIEVEPVETDHLTITFNELTPIAKQLAPRMRVDEVRINGQANPPAPQGAIEGCRSIGLGIESAPAAAMSLPVRIAGSREALLGGRPATFVACDQVELAAGWHLLATTANTPVDQVQLLSPGLGAPEGALAADAPAVPATTATVVSQSSTRIQLHVPDNQPGSVLLFDQSWDPKWVAAVNGEPLGSPRNFNAGNGWVLPKGGALDIDLRYRPQAAYGYSLIISVVGLVLCGWLALRRPTGGRATGAIGSAPPASSGPPEDAGDRDG